jgi:hypothetical protein
LLFQIIQIMAKETTLSCINLLLQSHLEANDKTSLSSTLKISCTSCQSSIDIKQSKNRCKTDSISLHKLHSKGFGISLFLKLSLVRILFCEKSERKFCILGGIFISQTAGKYCKCYGRLLEKFMIGTPSDQK